MNKLINREALQLLEVIGEVRFALCHPYQESNRSRIKQAISVIDYAAKNYSGEEIDRLLAILNESE